jgi:hypothetical protein
MKKYFKGQDVKVWLASDAIVDAIIIDVETIGGETTYSVRFAISQLEIDNVGSVFIIDPEVEKFDEELMKE